jgi:putative sterol carrier protein
MSVESILGLINEKTANAEAIGNTLRFDFETDCLHLDGTGATNVVSTEKKDADCTVDVAFEDFKQLLSGDLNPMAAVMSGKVKINGDMSVAMKLPSIFNS